MDAMMERKFSLMSAPTYASTCAGYSSSCDGGGLAGGEQPGPNAIVIHSDGEEKVEVPPGFWRIPITGEGGFVCRDNGGFFWNRRDNGGSLRPCSGSADPLQVLAGFPAGSGSEMKRTCAEASGVVSEILESLPD